MIVNAHLHINFNGLTQDNFIEYLDRNGFDKSCILTWDEVRTEKTKWTIQNLNIEEIINLYERYPDRVIPFYAPDPMREDALDLFIKWRKRGIKGYGELKSTIRWMDSRLDKILNYLNSNKLPLIFHIENSGLKLIEFNNLKVAGRIMNKVAHSKFIRYLSEPIFDYFNCQGYYNEKLFYKFPGYMLNFLELEKRLKQFPDIKFIAHGPYWWANISTNQLYRKYPKSKIKKEGIIIRLLTESDNLYCDLAGFGAYNALRRDTEFIKNFCRKFQNKILFGTDNYEFGQIKFLKKLFFSDELFDKITGQNILNILNI